MILFVICTLGVVVNKVFGESHNVLPYLYMIK